MNFFGHLKTVMKHRHLVFVHARKAGIFFQGLTHDLSKFSYEEFWIGVKYYQENRSPNEKERRLFGYSKAWIHHKGRNKHHFEYWIDYSPVTKKMEGIEMPRKYLIEMVCDRMAASKTYQGKDYTNTSPLTYFLGSKDRIMMHENTKKDLEFLLTKLSLEGEKELFRYIRKDFIKNKTSSV